MKIKTITYLLLITILLYGCTKCKEITGSTERVSPSDISILFPYKEGGKIKFKRNKKDTVEFQNLGLQTKYEYYNTEEDCPVKKALEQKYMQFVDSINGNNFYLINYRTRSYTYYFSIVINNVGISNSNTLSYAPKQPVISTNILGKEYDTVSVWGNHVGDSAVFKTKKYGLLKFTSNGNLLELIP